jgi:leucyl-tRNA synthetase
MEYKFREIEKKWQQHWKETNAYRVSNESTKPKFYVLDMFPYPSGAGLHVGHPLGYIASDIYSRFKRLKGFNVLHPMGYDAFGLPAEQYAIEHGIHPAVSTENNIQNFRKQLDNIGFCYDWDREVRTCDPKYYKWTQWIFLQLFNSFYNRKTNKAEPIANLIKAFEAEGSFTIICNPSSVIFSSDQWKSFDEAKKQNILMNHRLAYCGYGEVNWCEALGTVLANDEVVNGVSERGGHPVVKKKLRQWYLRITEYADRLLEGLERIEFSEAMKEMQTNWIGKSSGAEIDFEIRLKKSEVVDEKDKSASPPTPLLTERGAKDPDTQSGHYFQTADNNYWKILKEYTRENRKNQTEAEETIWQLVRNNKLGVKARRQHAVGGYIVDFAFLEVKLAVEIDGEYHDEKEQQVFDEARTKYLGELNIEVLRFTNKDVETNANAVVAAIKAKIEEKKSLKQSEGSLSLLREEKGQGDEAVLRVYTTRPDTIFGVDFMVIAPEHELTEQITTAEQKQAVEDYIAYVKSRSERERMAEKKISGVFTGAYAINPFDGREIPIWISEYVLAGYGTGAIMAVPCGDERDHKFAKHFNIPITNIIGKHYNGEEANATKDAVLENSGFLNGVQMRDAIEIVIKKLEEQGIGIRKVNFKMRDAAFSRQRYWGEPFPIVWKNGVAYPLDAKELPLTLPDVESYSPGPEGEGPLANIPEWVHQKFGGSQVSSTGGNLEGALETNTMPGYAGSSWYFLRYMDPHNDNAFCDRKVSDYWGQVDLYIGGTEHAVGHLLYSRMWTKALYDLGFIGHDEPYKKLVNQGMIQGSSRFVYRVTNINYITNENKAVSQVPLNYVYISLNIFKEYTNLRIEKSDFEKPRINISKELKTEIKNRIIDATGLLFLKDLDVVEFDFGGHHVDVHIVDGYELDIDSFKKWRNGEYANAEFILEDGKYICGSEVEKMSKSKFNTVNPDMIVEKYGADTFRMYEMFLGPVEISKPWDTKGIEGVHRFLKKLWRLFYDDIKGKVWNEDKANDAELKVLHKTIKKIEEDTERFSFNTGVSTFMIAVNELTDLKCSKKEILEQLLILLTPYAPHVSEELWSALGNTGSILDAGFPRFEEKYIKESSKAYPVAINGKTRSELTLPLDISEEEVKAIVLKDEVVQKWLEGKEPRKIIYVRNKMINVVI